MRQTGLVVAVVLFAVTSCGKKTEQDCQNEVADLTDWARTVGREPPTIVTGVQLVSRPEAQQALEEAPVLELATTGAKLNGVAVGTDTIGERLIDRAMKASTTRPSRQSMLSVVVAVDADTPWRVVADYATAMGNAGFNVLGFVFSVPTTVKPPQRTSVDDEIAKLRPDERVPGMAKILRGVIEPCKQLQDTFETLARYRSGDRGDILASGLGHGIHDCECKVDIPKLRSALYQLFAATPMRVVVVKLQSEVPPLTLPADMPWREASKKLPTALTWFTTH